MAFDLIKEFKQALPGWKTRLKESGIHSAYAAVTASALWPVAAAAQAGNWSGLMALGAALGSSVGGNLIANQLQKWQDEADGARQIAALPQDDPLREHLDTLLQRLDAFTAAREALPDTDKQWFQHTLRDELSRLGNLNKFAAQVTVTHSGSGGQAVGQGNVVAGEGGLAVGRDILGDVHVYPGAPPKNDAKAIIAYLHWLERTHAAVRINEIIKGVAGTDADPLQLRSVFVDLNVTLRIEEGLSLAEHLRRDRERAHASKASPRNPVRSPKAEVVASEPEQAGNTRLVNVFEALGHHPHLALIGDAGCGKSTIGQFLTLALTRARLDDPGLLARLGNTWTHGPLLPVPLVLREFAAGLPANHHRGCANDIWEYVRQNLGNCAQDPAWVEAIRNTVRADGGLFLLDGWDETLDPLRLVQIAEALADLIRNTPAHCRFLLTSRPYAWESVLLAAEEKDDGGFARLDPALAERMQTAFKALHDQLPTHYEVAKLERGQVERFIAGWYRAVQEGERPWFTATEAALKKADLETAAGREDLAPVVSNPLLLTLTASLSATHLPDDRADLFHEIVDLLLKRWTQRGGADLSLREAVGRDLRHEDIRQKIEDCAFAAHRGHVGQSGVADIPEAALKTAFASLLNGSDDLAKIVLEFVEKRAGLLLSKGLKGGSRQFSCPHRAFQEFLAGCHLSSKEAFTSTEDNAEGKDTPSALALARENPGHWREVLCFAARQARAERGSLAAHNLVHGQSFAEWAKDHQPTETDWSCAVVAGKQLLEIGLAPLRSTEATRLRLAHVAGWLGALIERNGLGSVRERLDVSLDLARLGDPRPGVGLRADGLPDLDWIEITPGPFTMGSNESDTPYEFKTPQFECHLITKSYRVSRYPVTVAQFQAFVDAGGYADKARQWWTRDGWKWKEGNQINGPEDYDPVFQTSNHPRVGVSWFEAIAFCRWLAERTRQPITLPSEVEWERAARHTDARSYPWPNPTDKDKVGGDLAQRCNMSETGIGHTSAVGLFPNGLAECGAADMAGNVWEWTRSLFGKDERKPDFGYPYTADRKRENLDAPVGVMRVMRGGSWGNVGPMSLRCASRVRNKPEARYVNYGFRCVLGLGGSAPG